jgi:hypothetical protein
MSWSRPRRDIAIWGVATWPAVNGVLDRRPDPDRPAAADPEGGCAAVLLVAAKLATALITAAALG